MKLCIAYKPLSQLAALLKQDYNKLLQKNKEML